MGSISGLERNAPELIPPCGWRFYRRGRHRPIDGGVVNFESPDARICPVRGFLLCPGGVAGKGRGRYEVVRLDEKLNDQSPGRRYRHFVATLVRRRIDSRGVGLVVGCPCRDSAINGDDQPAPCGVRSRVPPGRSYECNRVGSACRPFPVAPNLSIQGRGVILKTQSPSSRKGYVRQRGRVRPPKSPTGDKNIVGLMCRRNRDHIPGRDIQQRAFGLDGRGGLRRRNHQDQPHDDPPHPASPAHSL